MSSPQPDDAPNAVPDALTLAAGSPATGEFVERLSSASAPLAELAWKERRRITIAEALAIVTLLAAIETGAVTITAVAAEDLWAGLVSYRASDGAQLDVFFDAGDWDYLDRIRLADGTVYDYDALSWISWYCPPPAVLVSAYGMSPA